MAFHSVESLALHSHLTRLGRFSHNIHTLVVDLFTLAHYIHDAEGILCGQSSLTSIVAEPVRQQIGSFHS